MTVDAASLDRFWQEKAIMNEATFRALTLIAACTCKQSQLSLYWLFIQRVGQTLVKRPKLHHWVYDCQQKVEHLVCISLLIQVEHSLAIVKLEYFLSDLYWAEDWCTSFIKPSWLKELLNRADQWLQEFWYALYWHFNKVNKPLLLFREENMPNELECRVQEAAHVTVIVVNSKLIVFLRTFEALLHVIVHLNSDHVLT